MRRLSATRFDAAVMSASDAGGAAPEAAPPPAARKRAPPYTADDIQAILAPPAAPQRAPTFTADDIQEILQEHSQAATTASLQDQPQDRGELKASALREARGLPVLSPLDA